VDYHSPTKRGNSVLPGKGKEQAAVEMLVA